MTLYYGLSNFRTGLSRRRLFAEADRMDLVVRSKKLEPEEFTEYTLQAYQVLKRDLESLS